MTISSKIVAIKAKSQFALEAWNNIRSLQYQIVKPAPAPSSAYRIQALARHKPHNNRMLAISQTPPLTTI
jgi:hypothetical protein